MPLQRCTTDDSPGWKWGEQGKCYPFTAGDEESETAARKKALAQAAAMGEFPGTGNVNERSAHIPLETRDASIADINFAQRLVDIVAVPYEETSQVPVMYRGELWEEIVERGAFEGIESRQDRISANRNHDRNRTVGKVTQFWPSRLEGLVGRVKIGKTNLGDETLSLAEEDMLSGSVGFGVRGRDQIFDRHAMTRRIKRAFIDHLAFVEKPAYSGAHVLSVRGDAESISAADLPPLGATPVVDEYVAFLASLRRP